MAEFNLNTLLHRSFLKQFDIGDEVVEKNIIMPIPVRVPKIQRDYAEGRESEMIESKRRSLINDMLDVVYEEKKGLSLDFVYGYMRGGGKTLWGDLYQNKKDYPDMAFEPLDGQQRLTTLFLLYWLFGREKDLIDNGHSLFIYETRDTSEEFCHWLVHNSATEFIDSWLASRSSIKTQNEDNKAKWYKETNADGKIDPIANRLRFPLTSLPSLFEHMQTDDSFKWDWHDDPNIRSIIKVLESTINYIQERGLDYHDGITKNANLDNITFMLLDNLDCDGDQLFEKMNARGKALTSFEILKSSLEEEMERLGLSSYQLISDWREAIDKNWVDYYWSKAGFGPAPKLNDVREVEQNLEKLIIRIAGKNFYNKEIEPTPIQPNSDAVNFSARLEESISKRDSSYEVINRYIEYSRHMRSLKNNGPTPLDFKGIYDDIQNMIYQDSPNQWSDASALLPPLHNNNDATLLDDFVSDNLTHNTRVMTYAMLAYLKIDKAEDIAKDNIKKANFIDWMRFIRNVYNADNKNSGLDNFDDVKSSINAIDLWLAEYKNNYITGTNQDILKFIIDHINENHHGQESARILEETVKGDLRINGSNEVSAADWEKSILEAENNFYLWGQIIAPLSWSCSGKLGDSAVVYDKKLFDEYVKYLNMLFNPLKADQAFDALLIQAMLCHKDYRHNLKSGLGSLGRLNNDRDYSWKQYLRKISDTGYYGDLFKQIIDTWRLPANSSLSPEDLLKKIISSKKGLIPKCDWRYYIVNISEPQTLLEIFGFIRTNGRYVCTKPGEHPYYFRSNTFRTENKFEMLTTYLYFEKRLLMSGVKREKLSHTAEVLGAYADFRMPNDQIIRLSLASGDLYKIELVNPGLPTTILHDKLNIENVEIELQKLSVISSL